MPQQRIHLSHLSRSWIQPCVIGSFIFLVLQLTVIFDHLYSTNPSCTSPSFAEWTRIPNFVESILFCALVILQINRIMFKNELSSDIGSLYTTIFVSTLAGITSFLNLFTDWSGVCEDAFGVKLPGSIWVEWMICVPMLYYIVLATENIKKLTPLDKLVLLLIMSVFISGFCLQFTKSFSLSILLLVLSFSFFSIASILFYFITIYTAIHTRTQCESIQGNEYINCLRRTKVKLSLCLLSISPLFPIVYLLSLFRIINQDNTYMLIMCLNIFTKFLFISMVSNAYISIDSEFARIQLFTEISALNSAAIVSQSRKLFLRYIMHEVRVPLNSITMGLGYLEQNSELDNEGKEALLMMGGASEYMTQTLDKILNLQSIEEGTLTLTYAPFTIGSVIRRVRASVVNTLKEKQILLDIRVHPAVPKWLLGDAFRLEIVMINILNNALTFSNIQSSVEIEVTCDNLRKRNGSYDSAKSNASSSSKSDAVGLPTLTLGPLHLRSVRPVVDSASKMISIVTFTVKDHGPGIPTSDLPSLFTPFSQIRPHELQEGGGSGVGLVICKQIVELHGGTISCRSEVGIGCTFTFIIPFELCEGDLPSKSEHKSFRNTRLNKNRTSSESQNSEKNDMLRPAEGNNNSEISSRTDRNFRSNSNSNSISARNNQVKQVSEGSYRTSDGWRGSEHSNRNTSVSGLEQSLRVFSHRNFTLQPSTPGTSTSNIAEDKDDILCNIIRNHDEKKGEEEGEGGKKRNEVLNNKITKEVLGIQDITSREYGSLELGPLLIDSLDPEVDLNLVAMRPPVTNTLRRVLITDDVASNRKLLAMLLRKRGIQCTMASDGMEALELIQKNVDDFDMIFMDNSMPVMNGVDATRGIRAAGFGNLIVGVTGNALPDDVREFIAAGADSVILKPISIHQIHQIIEFVKVQTNLHFREREILFYHDTWEFLSS